MPSPQVVAREPGRRIKKSRKPERRAKAPVDTGDIDMESPTPSQQSAKAGAGTGAGRERSRRVSERIPRAAGAKAHEKSHAAGMLDKGIGKRMAKEAKQLSAGRKPPNGKVPPKRAAAAAEAAPTQKRVLAGKRPRKRTLRNEGVDSAQ